MKLFQRAKTGKVKWTDIYTQGAVLITEWGTQCSDKQQRVEKVCKAMNVGKSNELSAEEQALAEMEAKLTKKKDKGYAETLVAIDEVPREVTLSNLPKAFTPCKPIPQKNMKKAFEDHQDTYGQRKRDGHCIILVKTTDANRVYSRGMEDITFYMEKLPVVQDFFDAMCMGSMILTEFCFVKQNGKDCTRSVAKIVRKKDPVEVVKRYEEASKTGSFEIVPFDIMFSHGNFIGGLPYMVRAEHLALSASNVPEVFHNWKDKIDYARDNNWEGFVLRNDTLGSTIRYTLNGKADKAGSYKYVFSTTDDFIVTGAEHGKSGRHAAYYAQFFLSQYVNGELQEFGNCGPGKLDADELTVLKERIDSNELTFPFAVEIEFRDRQFDTGKLVFPVLQRLREDKNIVECIFEPDED